MYKWRAPNAHLHHQYASCMTFQPVQSANEPNDRIHHYSLHFQRATSKSLLSLNYSPQPFRKFRHKNILANNVHQTLPDLRLRALKSNLHNALLTCAQTHPTATTRRHQPKCHVSLQLDCLLTRSAYARTTIHQFLPHANPLNSPRSQRSLYTHPGPSVPFRHRNTSITCSFPLPRLPVSPLR
jgi:hypothetical protein